MFIFFFFCICIVYYTTKIKNNIRCYILDDLDFEYDKKIEKTILGESSKRKLNFDESPPLINQYQSNSQANFNITPEPIELQSASIENMVIVVAGKVLF